VEEELLDHSPAAHVRRPRRQNRLFCTAGPLVPHHHQAKARSAIGEHDGGRGSAGGGGE
jgi:hypothetical protein